MADKKKDTGAIGETHSIGRIDYIEPNDLNTTQNGIPNPYEDYSMFVNLEVLLPDRSSCGLLEPKSLNYSTTNGTLSFFSGTDGRLTTNYTDATNNGETQNNTSECIGIQDISISYDRNFVPQVNIKFIDARGLSFFAPQEKAYIEKIRKDGNTSYDPDYATSFISAIFMIPSPTFILRIRGFYGRTVSLRLERSSVKVSFDNNVGNFVIDTTFIGQMFGVYADLPMSYIILAPYFEYVGKEYWRTNTGISGSFRYKSGNSGATPVKTFIEYKQLVRTFNTALTKNGGSLANSTSNNSDLTTKFEYIKRIQEKYMSFLMTMSLRLSKEKKFFFSKQSGYTDKIFFISDKKEENEDVNKIFDGNGNFDEFGANINDFNSRFNETLTIPVCFKSEEELSAQIKTISDVELKVHKTEEIIPADKTEDRIERKEIKYVLKPETSGKELPDDIFSDEYFINLASTSDNKEETDYKIIIPQIKYIIDGSFRTDLENRKKKCFDGIREEREKKRLGNNTPEVLNILGFAPTVENFMNMIFYHMETFTESFYHCLTEIRNSERTVGSLGLSPVKTDLPDRIMKTPSAFVPPFPIIFHSMTKDGVKRDEYIRPGEKFGDNSFFTQSSFQELKLVNSIYQAIKSYSSYITELDQSQKLSEATGSGAVKTFLPSSLGDYIFNTENKNPYLYFNKYETEEDISKDLEWLFSSRLISATSTLPLCKYDFTDFWQLFAISDLTIAYDILIQYLYGIAYLEAYNFFAANPVYDKKIETFLNKFTDKESIKNEVDWLINKDWSAGQYPGTENHFFGSNGKVEWFKEKDNNNNDEFFIPIYVSGINELGNDANNIDFFDNINGNWIPIDTYVATRKISYYLGNKLVTEDIEEKTSCKNSSVILDSRPISENYEFLWENNPKFAVGGNGKFTEGKIFPFFTFNDNINLRDFQPTSTDDANLVFKGSQISCKHRSYGQIEKMCLPKPEDRSYQWLTMANKEGNEHKFPYPIFNYAFYVGANTFEDKYDTEKAIDGLNWFDNWSNTTGATVCKGFDVYDEQEKAYDGDELYLRKAYIFVWSVTYNQVFGYFQGTTERTKIDLLREGAFWWRYDEYLSSQHEPIAIPDKYKPYNECRPDEIFVPDDPYPSYRHKGNKGANNYKDIYNQNNFTIFTVKEEGTKCGFKKIERLDLFSDSRKKVLKEFFMEWALGSDFKQIRDCFEGDDSSSVEYVEEGIPCNFYPLDEQGTGKYEPKTWYSRIRKDGPCSTLLYDLYFKVYTFVDFTGPEFFIRDINWKTPVASVQNSEEKHTLLEWAFMSFVGNMKAFYNLQIEGKKRSVDITETNATDDGEGKDIKMSIYLTLKNLYERHFCGESSTRWKTVNPSSDFRHFMYIDSYYNDIRDKIFLNSTYVSDSLNNLINFSSEPKKDDEKNKSSMTTKTTNRSVLQYMSDIIENAGMSLSAFPLGNAMTDAKTIREMFTPNPLSESPFNTDNYFMCLYPDKPSENLNLSAYTEDYAYDDDSFTIVDIADSTYTPSATLPEAFQKPDGGFRVPAFGVSYGKQNQSYFTNMTINMDSFANTEFSIEAEQDIAVKGAQGPRESNLYGQSVYSIYSNYGYTISVESMGNMQIMPGMLFQLNNIPMFKGVYCIYSVSHSISQGKMTTSFTGGRMKKYSVPFAEVEIPLIEGGVNMTGSGGVEFNVYKDVILEDARNIVKQSGTNNEIKVSLYQMIRSDTAMSRKISNAPSPQEEENIFWFIDNYLLPIMNAWYDRCESLGQKNRKITITSGFRSPTLQKALNPGTKLSAHNVGFAADLVPDNGDAGALFSFCLNYFKEHGLKFDQLLNETTANSHWVHIGAKRPSTGEQRCQYFRMHKHHRPADEPVYVLKILEA